MADKIDTYCRIIKKAQSDTQFREHVNYDDFSKAEVELKPLLKSEKQTLRVAILGYKSALIAPWDPFTTEHGLPGSEECVVYASQELVKRGYDVDIYMDPPEKSIWRLAFSNPQWFPQELWHDNRHIATYDLVIMWRRFDLAVGRKRGKKVFVWLHDSPPQLAPGLKLPLFPKFDSVLILSEHHRRQFSHWPGFNDIPYTICGNGYVVEQFKEPMSYTNPYSIGYYSNYSRGLSILLLIWPEIKRAFLEATLSICYGREHWGTMTAQQLDWIVTRIEAYKDLGVTEYGKVGHKQLADIMQSTSIWAYPCNSLGETFCITAVKCQAAGCIPVTTRIAALNETVHPDAPHLLQINDMDDVTKYKDLLLATLERIRDGRELTAERQKYIEFARQFSWPACVDKWLALCNNI